MLFSWEMLVLLGWRRIAGLDLFVGSPFQPGFARLRVVCQGLLFK